MNKIETTQQEMQVAQASEEDETISITIKRSHLYALLLPLAFLLGLGAGYLAWGRDSVPASAVSGAQTQPQASTRYEVPVDDDPALGPEDAPITIIEFSDYQCPFCTRFHLQTFSQIMEAYGDQIRFVYRDFPLTSIHPEAFPAAEAANCAGEQGSYWAYHDKLFTGGPDTLGSESYLRYAQELGLDMGAFRECVDTRRYQSEVQADFEYAANLGVNSTPTFFINGIAVVGAQPFEVFQQIIESELSGSPR